MATKIDRSSSSLVSTIARDFAKELPSSSASSSSSHHSSTTAPSDDTTNKVVITCLIKLSNSTQEIEVDADTCWQEIFTKLQGRPHFQGEIIGPLAHVGDNVYKRKNDDDKLWMIKGKNQVLVSVFPLRPGGLQIEHYDIRALFPHDCRAWVHSYGYSYAVEIAQCYH